MGREKQKRTKTKTKRKGLKCAEIFNHIGQILVVSYLFNIYYYILMKENKFK